MSTRRQETEDLIHELESLRRYLMDDTLTAETPAFKDTTIRAQPKPAQKPASVSYLNIKSAPQISEAMKEELRSQASPLIQEFIDREMIKLEQQLINTLDQYLEKWMDNYNFSQKTDQQSESGLESHYFQSNHS